MSSPEPRAFDSPDAGMRRRLGTIAVFALAAVLYGRHVVDGFLADDFVYLEWARHGFWDLVRHTTVESEPRMIRPLPALLCLLGGSEVAAAVRHTVSVILHGACGVLVAGIAARLGAAGVWATLLGALFVAFPLFAEPVVWLSSAPDVWACTFALLAVAVITGVERPGAWRSVAAGGLFILALSSKESVLLLPLLLPLVATRSRPLQPAAVLGGVGLAYLGLRYWLFGGIGGYTVAGGSIVHLFDPVFFLRNLALQLPYRLLVAFKDPSPPEWLTATISAVLLAFLFSSGRMWRRLPHLLRAATVFSLALLPAAPVFSIDAEHTTSRVLYFPVAVLCIALALVVIEPSRRFRAGVVILVAYWSLATWHNTTSWHEAGHEVRRTRLALHRLQDRFPPGSTIFVDGHDAWRGAYVWRNGLAHAARLFGLRGDLDWRLGTTALLGNPARVGTTAFEVAAGPDGSPVDWTPCQLALATGPHPPLTRTRALGHRVRSLPTQTTVRLVTEPFAPGRPDGALAVLIRIEPVQSGPADGRLYWRTDLNRRFSIADSRRFLIAPRETPEVAIRLAADVRTDSTLQLQIDASSKEAIQALVEMTVIQAPPPCQ